MFFKTGYRQVAVIILFMSCVAGCTAAAGEPTASPVISETPPVTPTSAIMPSITPSRLASTFNIADYAFPDSIDPAMFYLFYLHGKITEDQGIPAISPDYGEYEYGAILEKLRGYGFVVVSEQRSKEADGMEYASRVSQQVAALLNAGVPEGHITVVGASKGAGIVIYISHFLENKEINYVLLSICHPDVVRDLKQNGIDLHGNVLSIYDSVDEFAGSCEELFALSEGKGLSRHDEIVLHIGTGHGILYKPLDEWIMPVVQWATQ